MTSKPRRQNLLRIAFLAFGLGFLYLPILIVIGYSFNASRLVTVWGGFSLQWYQAAFANAALMDALALSVKVGVLSASLATFFGTIAAFALDRSGRFPGRALFAGLLQTPVILPDIITGIALLMVFVALGLDRGFGTLVLAHASLAAGFVAIVVRARLATFDRTLEEAAADLGAAPLTGFWLVTLPNCTTAIAAGWLLAFTLSFDDLVIASFTSGPGASTLPIRIYSQVRLGVTPEINAIATILIVTVAAAVVTAIVVRDRYAR